MRSEKLKELKEYIEELKTVKTKKVLFPGLKSFLKREVYKCRLNNGTTIKREKLIKGGIIGSAAVIVPVTRENNIILTVEPRVFTERTVGVSVPAGYIEQNENAYEAALRELLEETGYIPSRMLYLGGFYQDSGCSAAYNKTFVALGCIKKEDQNLDRGEHIKLFECTYEEVLELIKMGYISDCNSLIALDDAKQFLKGR